MGATVGIVMGLLQKEILLLFGISTAMAIPSFLGIKSWLQNFTYHIDFSIWMFMGYLVIVAVVVLIIALATVAYQSYRAATANPAESLRVE